MMIKGLKAGLLAAAMVMAIVTSGGVQAAPTRALVREGIVVMMRHGVRPPTKDPAMPRGVAAQEWPRWDVAPGYLTAHGGAGVEVLGRDDARWMKLRDCGAVRIIADSDQRTIATARHWARAALRCTPPSIICPRIRKIRASTLCHRALRGWTLRRQIAAWRRGRAGRIGGDGCAVAAALCPHRCDPLRRGAGIAAWAACPLRCAVRARRASPNCRARWIGLLRRRKSCCWNMPREADG
jgi:hypothetical protein